MESAKQQSSWFPNFVAGATLHRNVALAAQKVRTVVGAANSRSKCFLGITLNATGILFCTQQLRQAELSVSSGSIKVVLSLEFHILCSLYLLLGLYYKHGTFNLQSLRDFEQYV